MSSAARFATKPIRDLFEDEISRLGGTVRDSFDDGQRLFSRAVLTNFRPVALEDEVQAGVALRADERQVSVHPYVFRLICKNGAIWAHALQTVTIEEPASIPHSALAVELGAAIRACGAPSAFETAVGEMHSAHARGVDMALQFTALLSGMASPDAGRLLSAILDNFHEAGDRTRFGWMNAITAVARDTDDPEARWRLEEFGAGVPVGRIPPSLKSRGDQSLQDAYHREIADRFTDLRVCAEEQVELVFAGR